MDAELWRGSQLMDLRAQVDTALDQLLPDAGAAPHRLHAAMRYAALGPGKRVRPLIALICAQHLGCAIERALPAACALELVHAASLVLDDLPCMDDADLRRGQPTTHRRYGEDVAVLTGVALLNLAYAVIAGAPDLSPEARNRMTALLSATVGTSGLVGGQDKDLQGLSEPTSHAVRQLHHEKTGVLFIAAAQLGALAAEADAATLDALHGFAVELGLAFQALDDLADAAELEGERPVVNMLQVLSREGLQAEVSLRLTRAKSALKDGGAQLAAMCDYVDLLMGSPPG